MTGHDLRAWYGPLPARQVGRVYDLLATVIEPRSELHFTNPFELLVAVVLSAQATDRSVNAAMTTLLPQAATPAAMLALGADGLKRHIRHIGLANTKARNLMTLCHQLLERHDGAVPDDSAALEALAGVGPKSASVIRNVAFGHPTIAVDTHVHRVANRLGLAATTTATRTQRVLEARTPRRHLVEAHHYLILHGRYTCTARRPHCQACVVADLCRWDGKTAPATRTPGVR